MLSRGNLTFLDWILLCLNYYEMRESIAEFERRTR